jgi:Trk K+ transport system NAD-binding subunit
MRVNVKSSFYVGETLLNISEATIQPGSPIEGWSIEKLEREFDLSVVSFIEEKESCLHPDPDIILKANSKILVLATIDTLNRLDDLNHPG